LGAESTLSEATGRAKSFLIWL